MSFINSCGSANVDRASGKGNGCLPFTSIDTIESSRTGYLKEIIQQKYRYSEENDSCKYKEHMTYGRSRREGMTNK